MGQLILRLKNSGRFMGEQTYVLQKKLTTVGPGLNHDIPVEADSDELLFSIVQGGRDPGGFEIMPNSSRARVRLNGDLLGRRTALQSCDRIEWSGGAAVFVDSAAPAGTSAEFAGQSLTVLQNIATTLHAPTGGVQAALSQTLEALVELSGAEEGYLLSEVGAERGWKLVASQATSTIGVPKSRRELFSNTILTDALQKRSPVYIENIIGHPYADAASIIEARIFSVACFPLVLDARVLGAVFLFTRSPGRSIKRERLNELGVLATQASLMMASMAELDRVREENRKLRSMIPAHGAGSPSPFSMICDEKSPVAELERKLAKLGGTSLNVVVQGETGTGKELVAREIHRLSQRAKGPFVAINCAAIPGTLLESTLFGYERGAFTGAVKSQEGKFTQANGGTLFLDEIGDLPLELQAKLLRALQEQLIEPLGATKPVKIDVRVVSATHRNLEAQIRQGAFRQDLYFRLAGVTVTVPALRSRKMDIPLLAHHFLAKAKPGLTLSASAVSALQAYPWPGNVRELEHVITRAALLADANEIQPADLELQSMELPTEEEELFWENFETLDQAQLAFTHSVAQKCLARTGGNRAKAAERLGVSERTLYRILSAADTGTSVSKDSSSDRGGTKS